MKNRKLLLIVSIVLALTMSLGGTLAYLTDTDADVNTMVLGNVKIVQNEQEWNADKTALQEFTQDKPLLPYVGTLGWENQKSNDGAYRRFTMNNVVDKYVTVTNMGNTKAYVRTIIALEMGGCSYEELGKLIGVSINKYDGSEFQFEGAWNWTDDYVAQIDGKSYNIMVAVHQDALDPKETTIPSLLQVYLSKDADNEHVEKLDGNKNGKFDILVISQAVQADGFINAAEALEAGFGKVTANERETVASWFASIGKDGSDYQVGSPEGDKNDTNNPPYVAVDTVEELLAAEGPVTATAPLTLTENVTVSKTIEVSGELELNLNNMTLTGATDSAALALNGESAEISNGTVTASVGDSATGANGWYAIAVDGAEATLTNVDVKGAGIGVYSGEVTYNSGEFELNVANASGGRYSFYVTGEGTVVNINGGEFSIAAGQNLRRAYIYADEGTTVYVNGGTFGEASTRSGYTAGIMGEGNVIITGGTFGFDPTKWVAAGYRAVETDGVWTVSAN